MGRNAVLSYAARALAHGVTVIFVAIFLMINIVLKYVSLSEHSLIRGKKSSDSSSRNNERYGMNNNKAMLYNMCTYLAVVELRIRFEW